jgi:hypothetical protein
VTIFEELTAEPKRDRYGRPMVKPIDGGKPKPYTRPTTIADTLDDRHNLELWLQRQVAKGLAARPDLMALVTTTDGEDKSALNDLCRKARDAAASDKGANMGTAVHAAIEAVNRDTDVTTAAMFAADVAAYLGALDAHGATVDRDHVEQFVVNDDVGAAGTFDMRLNIGGVWYVADLKTGATVEWSAKAFAVQLAIYQGHTSTYDWATETHGPRLDCDPDRGIIVHLPAGTGECTLHWIDLAAGREALERALWVRGWRKRRDLLVPVEIDEGGPHSPAQVQDVGVGTVERPTRRPRRNPHIRAVTDGEPVHVADSIRQVVTAIRPVTAATPKTAPEGDAVPAERVEKLLARVHASTVTLHVMARWAREAAAAGTAWNVQASNTDSHTERRCWLTAAALEIADHAADGAALVADVSDDADELARAVLAVVLGDDAHQPLFSVGGLIGTLTVDQARHVHKIAAAGPVIVIDDDGTARVKTA